MNFIISYFLIIGGFVLALKFLALSNGLSIVLMPLGLVLGTTYFIKTKWQTDGYSYELPVIALTKWL